MNLSWADVERFWSRVKIGAPDECWPYTGARQRSGYGTLLVWRKEKRRNDAYSAHRVSFFLTNGEIPEGLEVCHRCDNPPCCNPAHIFVGSHSQNMKDMVAKGRGGPPPGPWPRHGPPPPSWKSQLTAADVRAIRRELAAGARPAVIAPRYGLTTQSIERIRRRATWAHIDPPDHDRQESAS